jgi:hypothetical protein
MPTTFDLVCPFLDHDPRFAYGVEFGMLFARMRDGDEGEIAGYYCMANQDQILLLASRLGWSVDELRPWGRDWFWCRLERGTAPA